MSKPFIFPPLNPAANEIRLLKLLPGRTAETISCTLDVVSLDDSPKYEALSYVCGDPADTRGTLVNGLSHNVTVNLEAALRGLRRHGKSRRLWADAVCIDQDNIPEKNNQVPKMSDIYTQASRVLVWLGEPTPLVKETVTWARRRWSTGALLRHLRLKICSPVSRMIEIKGLADGYSEVFCHPYWSRMWTFQEFTLTPAPPLFVWANIKISSDKLMARANAAIEEVQAITSDESYTPCPPAVTTYRGKFEMSMARCAAERAVRKSQEYEGASLPAYLLETAGRACHDRRDRVYALYGLVPELRQAFPPDYNKPVERVMHDTALFQAGTPAGLDLFIQDHALYENRLSTSGWALCQPPSWVPDLTTDRGIRQPSDPAQPLFWNQSRLSDKFTKVWGTRSIETTSNGRALHLRARKVGDCQCLVRFSDRAHDVLSQLSDTLDRCIHLLITDDGWRDLVCDTARLDLGERLVHALIAAWPGVLFVPAAETLLLHLRVLQVQVAVEEALSRTDGADEGSFRPMHLWTEEQLGRDDELSYATKLLHVLSGAVLFTVGGYVGISGPDVRDHDAVVVADGFSMPLVLRRTEFRFEISDEYEYKLVGHAYVDGLMDNRYEDPELVTRILDQDKQTFYVS